MRGKGRPYVSSSTAHETHWPNAPASMRYILALCVALLAFLAGAYGQRARVKRPNLKLHGGAEGEVLRSASVRRGEAEFVKKVKQKMRENPEMFRPVPALDPMTTKYPPRKGDCGQTVLNDRVVSTTVIITDELMARYDLMNELMKIGNETIITAATFAGGDIERKINDKLEVIQNRTKNAREVLSQLPLAYEEWPSVNAGECPQANYAHTASERGVAMAHSLIWKDFYFRHSEKEKKKKKSRCDLMEAANGDSSGERDLLLVFEDDVQPTIPYNDIGPALVKELDNMKSMDGDAAILFLGWCYGGLRSMPMCGHAYVLNLKAVKVLVEQFMPCGRSVDGQWHELARLKQLKWRKAHHESYNGTAQYTPPLMTGAPFLKNLQGLNKLNADTGNQQQGEATYFRGLFKQGDLGTFNGHSFMPNA